MKPKTRSLNPEDCIAFALECESDAQREQDGAHRERLLRMARVVRDLAADLDRLPARRN
jgi:hypothetical protein